MPKPIRVTERCRRIVHDIATVVNDRETYDKPTRKLAENTDARHVEAWMRLEERDRCLEALSDEEHLTEVLAAIISMPTLGARHFEALAKQLRIPRVVA